jgi:hypothetical protein
MNPSSSRIFLCLLTGQGFLGTLLITLFFFTDPPGMYSDPSWGRKDMWLLLTGCFILAGTAACLFLTLRQPASAKSRLQWALVITGLAVFVIYFANVIHPMMNLTGQLWGRPGMIPVMRPVGADFRNGMYIPASQMLAGRNPYLTGDMWPPFSTLVGMLFTLLPVETGYLVHAVLLVLSNVAAIYLSVRIASRAFGENDDTASSLVYFFVGAAVLFLSFNSYGYEFSLERGNIDIYSMTLALAAIWLLVTQPEKLWMPVILVSLATHLKVYPAILFVIIFWRHRWQCVLPILLCNGLLLFCLGFSNGFLFIQNIFRKGIMRPSLAIYGHSANSYSKLVGELFATGQVPVEIPSLVLAALPVILWAVSLGVLWRRGFNPTNVALLFAVSVPLMNLLPPTSNDYKTILLNPPVIIMLSAWLLNYLRLGSVGSLNLTLWALLALLFVTRSYVLLPQVLGNKYPFILFLLILFTLSICFQTGGRSDKTEKDRGKLLPASDRSPKKGRRGSPRR